MSVIPRRLLLIALTVFLLSCSHSPSNTSQVEEVTFTEIDTVMITGNGASISTGPPVVGPDSRLYAKVGEQIAELSWEGEILHTFGRMGEGPGELSSAASLKSHDDFVVVHHSNRSSLSLFSPEGKYQRTVLLEVPDFPTSVVALQGDRLLAGPAHPEGGLVSLTTLENQRQNALTLGDSTLVPVPDNIDPDRFHESIDKREIPEPFRDMALTLFDAGGNTYLVYQAYARVQKFSPEGDLLWDVEVPFREKEAIFNAFIEENSGGGMMRFQPLRYFTDAGHYDGRLQLMSCIEKTEGDFYCFVLELNDGTGEIIRRINFPAMDLLPYRFIRGPRKDVYYL